MIATKNGSRMREEPGEHGRHEERRILPEIRELLVEQRQDAGHAPEVIPRRRCVLVLALEQPQVHLLERGSLGDDRLDVGARFDQASHDAEELAAGVLAHGDRQVSAPSRADSRRIPLGDQVLSERRGRLAEHDAQPRAEQTSAKCGRRVERDQACAQHRDARGDPLDFVEVVRREHDGRRSPRAAQNELAHFAGALGIESRRRLVEQDDVGLVQQRARQRDALLQPFRQLSRRYRWRGRGCRKRRGPRRPAWSGSGSPCSRA